MLSGVPDREYSITFYAAANRWRYARTRRGAVEDRAEAKKPTKQSSAIQQNAHDKLAVKLGSFRERSQARKLERQLEQQREKCEKQLCRAFLFHVENRLGIEEEFVKELSNEDIDEIDRYLFERSKKCRVREMVFCVCVPIFGWLRIPILFDRSLYDLLSNYSLLRRSAIKPYNNDGRFPYHTLREIIK